MLIDTVPVKLPSVPKTLAQNFKFEPDHTAVLPLSQNGIPKVLLLCYKIFASLYILLFWLSYQQVSTSQPPGSLWRLHVSGKVASYKKANEASRQSKEREALLCLTS